jgi:hypothetical protein
MPAFGSGAILERLRRGNSDSLGMASIPEPPAGTVPKFIAATNYQGASPEPSVGGLLNLEGIGVARFGEVGIALAPVDLPGGSRIRRVDFGAFVFGVPFEQQAAIGEVTVFGSPDFSSLASVEFLASADDSALQWSSATLDHSVDTERPLILVNSNTVIDGSFSTVSAAVGAIVHYVPPARSFVPVTPFRVYDTRWNDFGPRYTGNSSRVVSVADARNSSGAVTRPDAVPAGAVAITFNITAINTSGSGLLSVTPGTSGSYSTATLNWATAGNTLGNASTVAIDTNRRVKIFSSGAATAGAHVTLDVTGFYI